MSRREEILTRLFCDETDCPGTANGPCLVCGKDLCPSHGQLGFQWHLQVGTKTVFICPEHRTMTLQELEDALTSVDSESQWARQWEAYQNRAGEYSTPKKIEQVFAIL